MTGYHSDDLWVWESESSAVDVASVIGNRYRAYMLKVMGPSRPLQHQDVHGDQICSLDCRRQPSMTLVSAPMSGIGLDSTSTNPREHYVQAIRPLRNLSFVNLI